MSDYIYVEAPNRDFRIKDWQRTVFLGGSITGAGDWQKSAAEKLLPYFSVFNPRRENFDVKDASQERIQILWESDFLEFCAITVFYFAPETLAPITLYETGKMLEKLKTAPWRKIYIAIHPDYKRKNDVLIQTELTSKETAKRTCFDLNEMLEMVILDKS